MAKFLTGEELSNSVYDIIFSAKKKLLIVSPYIKLDDYFKKELFDKHRSNPELHIIIAFGKNKLNPVKSFNQVDFDYFKSFPYISIVYVPNLHAKYYANEEKGIITSINLYDYSFKNNIEFGVVSESKLIGGSKIDQEAWQSAMGVLGKNYALFIKRPVFKKKFIGKDYMRSDLELDLTQDLLMGNKFERKSVFDFLTEKTTAEEQRKDRICRAEFEEINNSAKKVEKNEISINKECKLLSATALGKLQKKSYSDVISTMTERGYLSADEITVEGADIGIQFKTNSKGDSWIVYPEFLQEIL